MWLLLASASRKEPAKLPAIRSAVSAKYLEMYMAKAINECSLDVEVATGFTITPRGMPVGNVEILGPICIQIR